MSLRKQILVAAALVLVGVAWGIHRLATSPEWRQFSAAALWGSMARAHPGYLLLGGALIFASYLARAYRWKAFLKPMKEAPAGGLFVATLVGFSAVALLGRAGEVVRPWMIAQRERLPLASQLGAWTLERVFDTLTLVGLMGASLWLYPIAGEHAAAMMRHFRTAGLILTTIALLLAAVLALIHYAPQSTEKAILALARPLPHRIREAIRNALEHFAATLAVIRDARSFLECVSWSLLVWLSVLGTYWCVAQAFGGPLAVLHISALTLVMMASVTGSVAQLPAVGGGVQLATALVLTELFHIPLAQATAGSLMLWALCFLLVLIPGLPLAAREGLSWSRLRSLLAPECNR
ncbi:MAG TPA: lysylphosphatidylglycerol synthase transmembrane domain-containing protein [Terriglobia bacterium]|nr:lysylphosphatidylglycerol synthase transmembrane domain-containing protein [Terriglobia bacterium]